MQVYTGGSRKKSAKARSQGNMFLLVAVLFLVGFIGIASTAGFKDSLFNTLFPKPQQHAAGTTPKITLTFPSAKATGFYGVYLPADKNNAVIATIDNDMGVSKVVFAFSGKAFTYDSSEPKYVTRFDTSSLEGASDNLTASAYDSSGNLLSVSDPYRVDINTNISGQKNPNPNAVWIAKPVSTCVNGKPVLSIGWMPPKSALSYRMLRIDGATGKKYILSTPSIAGEIDNVAGGKDANGNIISPLVVGATYSYQVDAYKDISLTQLLGSQVSIATTIPGTVCPIHVLSPNGGETFKVGDKVNITWETDGHQTAGFSIGLGWTVGAGQTLVNIVTVGPNVRSYTWTAQQNSALKYEIRVEDAGDGKIFDMSDNPFTIISKL